VNLTPIIFEKFKERAKPLEVLLIPGYVPVLREEGKLERLSDKKLTPEDVRETLASLRQYFTGRTRLEPDKGFFSFGLPNVGRVRVLYFLQRGSLILSVVKTPYTPPVFESVSDKDTYERLKESISSKKVVAVLASSYTYYSLFVASFLRSISEEKEWLIYTLERPVFYLFRHLRSLFIQREIGIDLENLEEGLREALILEPNLVYLNDVFYTTGEITELLEKFYPFPFSVVFPKLASPEEADSLKDGAFKSLVQEVWVLKPEGQRINVEVKGRA